MGWKMLIDLEKVKSIYIEIMKNHLQKVYKINFL